MTSPTSGVWSPSRGRAPGAIQYQFDWGTTLPSMAIVETVAIATDAPVEELTPLSTRVDVDALDEFFEDPSRDRGEPGGKEREAGREASEAGRQASEAGRQASEAGWEASEAGREVSFTYCNHEVTVEAGGRVTVRPLED